MQKSQLIYKQNSLARWSELWVEDGEWLALAVWRLQRDVRRLLVDSAMKNPVK